MVGWLIPLLIGMALNVIAYLLMPKPKQNKPDAAKEMEKPTAEAGRPIPALFGTITIKGSNILWWGEKYMREYKVSAKGGKGGK